MSNDEILTDGAIIDVFKEVLKSKYYDKISELKNSEQILFFKYSDFPENFVKNLWDESEHYLKLLNEATKDVYTEIYNPHYDEYKDLPFDKINTKLEIDTDKVVISIKKIKHAVLQKLVVFDGNIITKTAQSEGNLEDVTFSCNECGVQFFGSKPRRCGGCQSTNIYLDINQTNTKDLEILTIQEKQEDMSRQDTIPKQIEVIVKGDLCHKFKIGEVVRVTGFVKPEFEKDESSIRKTGSSNTINTIKFKYRVEAHNIQPLKTSHQKLLENPELIITPEVEKKLLDIRAKYTDKELLNLLVRSFATNVYGHDAIKKALLVQNVGLPDIVDERNMINILIIGDPGLAKTRLVYEAIKISTHYAIAVGKGASGVGLTASITKDDNGNPKISIGAAVIADGGGLCVIEELGNISDEYRAYLLESMENGTVTINKHGINTTLNARAAYLVTSNPDSGKYQESLGLHGNLTITPQLLSRFDIIYVVMDKVNKAFDSKLITHIFERFERNLSGKKTEKINDQDILDHDTLVQYLFYAKTHNRNNIIISDEAKEIIGSFYHDLRETSNSSDFSATPRQLEGSIRFSMALTRLLLKNEITGDNALEAIQMLNDAYESAGMRLKGGSTGLNGNMIYPKDLNKMNEEKAAIEIIKYVTNDGQDPRDRDFIVTAFRKELKDKTMYDCGKLFEKLEARGLLRLKNSKWYV